MGLPLILIGASAGSLLPRTGAWMVAVKSLFGFVLLGVAIWVLSPVLPAWMTLACWSALALALGVYLLTRAVRGTRGRTLWLARAFGTVALTAGLVLGVGTATGARDPLHPLEALTGSAPQTVLASPFVRVRDTADLDAALLRARGKYVMLDFYADWCVSCKEMERYTFADPRVRDHMKDMVLLQADVTANSAADAALLRRFGLFGPPGIVFFDRSGAELGGQRVVGFQASDRFLSSLGKVLCC
jgi:thioredoxin:protein disulfide reductase